MLALPMAGASDMARAALGYLSQVGGLGSGCPYEPKATRSSIHD
jgi:hypothetical protein